MALALAVETIEILDVWQSRSPGHVSFAALHSSVAWLLVRRATLLPLLRYWRRAPQSLPRARPVLCHERAGAPQLGGVPRLLVQVLYRKSCNPAAACGTIEKYYGLGYMSSIC